MNKCDNCTNYEPKTEDNISGYCEQWWSFNLLDQPFMQTVMLTTPDSPGCEHFQQRVDWSRMVKHNA